MVCGYPSQGGKIKSERYKTEASGTKEEVDAKVGRYDNLRVRVLLLVPPRGPPRGYLSQGSKVKAGRRHEDEIRSKKDAEPSEITYVCATVFV